MKLCSSYQPAGASLRSKALGASRQLPVMCGFLPLASLQGADVVPLSALTHCSKVLISCQTEVLLPPAWFWSQVLSLLMRPREVVSVFIYLHLSGAGRGWI